MSKKQSPVSSALYQLSEARKELKLKRDRLVRNKTRIDEVLSLIGKVDEGPWVIASDFGNSISISCSLRGLDGFKDGRLFGVLDRVMSVADDASSVDYPDYLNRDYKLRVLPRSADEANLVVRIGAYVRGDSETCRKVLKEVKSVVREEKVYELVCN